MPTTVLGKWSIGFAVAFIVLFAIFFLVAAGGETGGNTLSDNLWLAVPGILADVFGIITFLTSLVAIAKYKERSSMVIVAFAFGFMLTVFTLGEVVFPH